MGGLRGCPSSARVHVLISLCLHGWIERESNRGSGTCVGLIIHGWIERVSIRCQGRCVCMSLLTWVD